MKAKLPWILTILLAIALIASLTARTSTKTSAAKTTTQTATTQQKKILYWVDPMHPSYKSDKPGTAPDCGMDLVPVYEDGTQGGAATPVAGYSNVKLPSERQ